ncbi:MAG: hypothetical protein KC421_17680, partial [Anaerolineales bacterium]|nr:hypothetical protein [Anaerolineales bacterium]
DLARQLNIMPYGIEIHEERAAEAAERLSTFHTDTGITPVIPGSYTETKISPQAFSLIYNNPPYVFVDDKNLGRAEYAWLRDTRPLLTIDGLMIWVVPRHMLNHRRAAGYLVSWFRDIQVYKFPEPLYNRFKQIIVFGVRRPHATIGDHEYIEKLRSMGKGEIDIPALPELAEPMYTLPADKPGKFEFRSLFVDPEVARAEALDILNTNAELQAMLLPKSENLSFRPLTPLKVGHLTSIISAGLLNNQMLDDGHEQLLIKGMSYKRKQTSSSREEKEDGGYKIKTSHTEQFVTTITTLHQDGRV